MNFTYRATAINETTGQVRNVRLEIPTETWMERISDQTRYGNSKELIDKHLSPLARDESVEAYYGTLFHLYDQWKKHSGIVIFEYAMYMWAEYKAGKISSKVWAAALGVAWQSGARGMMACVVLSASQIRDMFKAADLHTLHDLVAWKGEDLNELYASLPDTMTVYRGVSTGISHFEDGLSWTRNSQEEPLRFAVLNCQTKKEIPGFLTATIRKESVLALFSFEQEVVVDPAVAKIEVKKEFLRGNELRSFHKKYDVEGNARDVALNWRKR